VAIPLAYSCVFHRTNPVGMVPQRVFDTCSLSHIASSALHQVEVMVRLALFFIFSFQEALYPLWARK